MSNPYAQQPPASPWVPSQPDPYGQPQPGQQHSAYGQEYPGYGQSPYGRGPAPSNTSAIVLTIVSGLSMLSTLFFVGVPSLIFGIMALASNSTDPVGSRKKARTGWIVYGINVAVIVFVVILGVIALVAFSTNGSSSNFDSGF